MNKVLIRTDALTVLPRALDEIQRIQQLLFNVKIGIAQRAGLGERGEVPVPTDLHGWPS
jgi:hypothetical protein